VSVGAPLKKRLLLTSLAAGSTILLLVGLCGYLAYRTAAERIWEAAGLGALSLLALTALGLACRSGFRIVRDHLGEIQSSQSQTQLIIDSVLDGVLITDAAGSIELANPAAVRMFGAEDVQLCGKHISELLPHRPFVERLSKVGASIIAAEGRRVDPPHTTFPVEVSLSGMGVDGALHHVALVRDTKERNRSEEALRHIGLGVSSATGEAFVKTFVTQLSHALQFDGAFLIECDPGNPEGAHHMTLAEKGMIQHGGPCDLTGTACANALQTGPVAYAEGAQTRFPTDWILAAFSAECFVAMPLVDADGTCTGLIGVLDRRPMKHANVVSSTLQIFAARAGAELQRKRFERDIAAEKERLAVTLRSIGDGCITIDNDGVIALMNPVAERLTGWTQAEASGKNLGEVLILLNEQTRRPYKGAIAQIIESGSAAEIVGMTLIVSREGTERIIETNAAPIREGAARKNGVVLVLRDVTERYRILEERQKAEKLDSLGVAAGGIAHDFNNLLTAILGNLSLVLFNPKLDPGIEERLVSAKKASLRAQELAQQLLTFAKGGAPIKQTASVAQLLRDTAGFSLRGSNTRSEFQIAEDLWPAEIDAGQMSQVIQNLALNADQAMPAGGTLRIGCENVDFQTDNARPGLTAGRYIKVTVQDEGIGIPEEYVKKIFDPYFTTKPKGSGLGLATAYSIIRSHNGIIEVVSQPGEGTCFFIYLPASDGLVLPVATEAKAPISHHAARVLVLDDEEAICALVTCALEPLGYEVVETNDALTAIARYQEALDTGRRFDVVISDLTIPGGMGGQEAVRRLQEIDPTVKAIVSSGYAMDPVLSEFRQHGFCAMIAKPYEIDALGRTVAEVLARVEAQAVNVVEQDLAVLETA